MRKSRLATAFAAVVLSFAFAARAEVLDTSLFAKKIHFTASGYAGGTTLANFPVLVRLSDVSGFSFADFTTPADELRFTDASGNNLNYEIDTWDSSAGKALVWVSVPSLSGTTTTEFRAYYGPSSTSGLPAVSSSAVWTSAGYVGVWHFNTQNADGSYPDATGLGATAVRIAGDATPNAPTSAAPNANGTTYHVANSVLAVQAANTTSWTFSSTGYSVETWLVPTGNYNRMFVQSTGMNTGNAFAFGPTEIYQLSGEWGKYNWPSVVANQTDWRFVTAVWANSAKSFKTRTCVNGSTQAGTKDKLAVDFSSTGMALTGRNGTDQGSTVMNFSVDEIRVRPGDTSDDWMNANYATQNDPAFLTAGPVMDCRSVELSLSVNGGTCAKFSSLVDGVSLSGGQSATLKILYGTAENALSDEIVVPGSITTSGTYPAQIKGLTRGTAYYFKSVLVLANSTTIESAVLPVTTLADFTTAMRRVEYIEGSGTQYIDSGYYPTPNTHIKADYQFTAKVNQYRVFGIEGGNFSYQCYINSSGNWAYTYADVAKDNFRPVSGDISADTERHLFDFNYIDGEGNRAYTIYGTNGTVTQSPLETTGATKNASLSLVIGSMRSSATEVKNIAKHRIYSAQLDEGGALTTALAPAVRTSDGAVGLYDSARNMFLQSASADSYVLGPSITTIERFTDATLTAVDLTFLGAPMARTLKVAYGSGFGGDNPADWDVTETVATVAAGATSCTVTAIPANWGSDDACVLRCYFDDGTTFPLWSDTIVYKATLEPSVSVSAVDGIGGDSFVVHGTLGYFPGDDCTLSVRVTKSGGSPVVWSNLATVTETGTFELTLLESDTAAERYIEPGATYSVVVEATSGGTSGSSSAVFATTKGAPVFASSSSSVNQRKVTFNGNLSDLGANTNATVTLLVGTQDNANSLESVETPVMRTATGAFNIVHNFADFETTYYWQLCAVATTAGGNAITTRTSVASCKTLDAATYTWKAVDDNWNGNWNDPAHWSSDKTDCFGFPNSSNAKASFLNCTTNNPVVVAVNGKYAIGELKYYGSAASDITFVGTGTAESSLSASVTYGANGIKANSKVEFRDMTLGRTGENWDFQRGQAAATNILVRFSNVYSTGAMLGMSAAFSRLEFIDSEITSNSRFNFGGSNSVLVVSNSTITMDGKEFHFGADVADSHKGPVEMIISGKASKIVAGKFYVYGHSDGYDATITLMVPVGGFADAPLQQTGDSKFQNGGGANSKIKFAVSPASPALRRRRPVIEDHVIVSTKKGFETGRVGGIGTVLTRKGKPCGAFAYGLNRVPFAEGADLSTARQILVTIEGQEDTTVFILQ